MIELEPGPGPNEWRSHDLAVVLVLDLAPPAGYEFPWKMRVYGEWVPTRGRTRAAARRIRRWRTPHDALEWVVRNIPSVMRERPGDKSDFKGPVRSA